MKQSFKKRVIVHLLREGWNVKHSTTPFIDFFSVRRSTPIEKAYRVKPHGHLTHKEQEALHEYGKTHKMHVLYAHESAGHEIEFVRLYPKNI